MLYLARSLCLGSFLPSNKRAVATARSFEDAVSNLWKAQGPSLETQMVDDETETTSEELPPHLREEPPEGCCSQQARRQQNPNQNSALLFLTPCGALEARQENLSHPSLTHPILPQFPLNRNPAESCPTLLSAAGFSVSTDN
ncbi:uncharacterized protein LOC120754461 isoform X2 [Hirundo rustica]|uniref:uncharacterized protein LOC120754461 isoform X2 n=1 Tax=Hirundo rustica TaxID=43150 RepID=UPI001A942653|nr:uncharacterized protein LOC120754461 isoform X2 [Hirundo rustica]